jgi:hypothetical protein
MVYLNTDSGLPHDNLNLVNNDSVAPVLEPVHLARPVCSGSGSETPFMEPG